MADYLMDAGCDALHCTANDGTEAGIVMREVYAEHFRTERAAGNDVHSIAPSGYHGDQCGSVFLGERGTHLLLQARGTVAKAAADRLRDCGDQPHVTRCDWQATFRPPCTESEAAQRYRRLIDSVIARRESQSAQRGIVHTSTRLANSYYLVSGGGKSLWRTYNKHREDPNAYPRNTWRHEWQIGGKRAPKSWAQFCESRDQQRHAVGTLRAYLLKCGLDEPFLRDAPPITVVQGKHRSDTQRRLDWLESTVSSVVNKLLIDGVSMEEIVSLLTKSNGIKGWYFERGTLEQTARVQSNPHSHKDK